MRIARFASVDGLSFGLVEGPRHDVSACRVREVTDFPWGSDVEFTGKEYEMADIRLLAPILPTKIVAVGQNYIDHAAEMKSATTDEPLIFLKPPTAVIGPDAPIRLPKGVGRVDHEGELAVVIRHMCRSIDAADAQQYILGYTVANDVTARDIQHKEGQWTHAKGYDTFCPLGPWIETQADPSDLDIVVTVTHPDGEEERRQDENTAAVVHTVSEIVEYVSHVMTLLPGDVILTGTPAGIASLAEGDRVDVFIDGIGTLSNPVEG